MFQILSDIAIVSMCVCYVAGIRAEMWAQAALVQTLGGVHRLTCCYWSLWCYRHRCATRGSRGSSQIACTSTTNTRCVGWVETNLPGWVWVWMWVWVWVWVLVGCGCGYVCMYGWR